MAEEENARGGRRREGVTPEGRPRPAFEGPQWNLDYILKAVNSHSRVNFR